MVKYKKCPRCELNYIEEDKDYCDVCLAEMQGGKLKFADHTSLGLKMELMDKLTSNPVLFVRCFLNALDSSILGESVVTSRRRRITTDASQPHAEPAQEDTAEFRKIDLSPSDLSGLSASEKYAPGRQIEL